MDDWELIRGIIPNQLQCWVQWRLLLSEGRRFSVIAPFGLSLSFCPADTGGEVTGVGPLCTQDTAASLPSLASLVAQWWRVCLQCRSYRKRGLGGEDPWRRAWHAPPVILPGERHGQRSLGATVQGVAKSWTWLSNLALHDDLCLDSPVAYRPIICLQWRRGRRHCLEPWVVKILWRRKWQPSPVFLPGKFRGQSRLLGCSARGREESGTTEHEHAHRLPFSHWMPASSAPLSCDSHNGLQTASNVPAGRAIPHQGSLP